ncbi:MAG: hypothetical protein M1838_002817 [Thelocarpon superellum]|nr:MAG: hypothetical protein M1838_002817 [Thelocarpon superellum]
MFFNVMSLLAAISAAQALRSQPAHDLRARQVQLTNASAVQACITDFDCTLTSGRIDNCNSTILVPDDNNTHAFQSCVCADSDPNEPSWKGSFTNCANCLLAANPVDPNDPYVLVTQMATFCNSSTPNATAIVSVCAILDVVQYSVQQQSELSSISAADPTSSSAETASVAPHAPVSTTSAFVSNATSLAAGGNSTMSPTLISAAPSLTSTSTSTSVTVVDKESPTGTSVTSNSASTLASSSPLAPTSTKGGAQSHASPGPWSVVMTTICLVLVLRPL